MRCCSCNVALSDFESTRKTVSTGEFLDMCNRCYADIANDVPTIVNNDFECATQEENEEDGFDWEEE